MDSPLAEHQLMEIHQLEAGVANQEDEMLKSALYRTSSSDENDCGSKLDYRNQMCDSNQAQRSRLATPTRKGDSPRCNGTVAVCATSSREKNIADSSGRESVDLADIQSLNILQSLGQSLHIFDRKGLVIYWNPMAEYLYGYSASEMLGRSPLGHIIEECDFQIAKQIVRRNNFGQCWTGQFPVRNKQGRRFQVIATHTPLYDDYGTLVGIVCVTCESQPFLEITSFSAPAKCLSSDTPYFSYGPPKSDLTTTNGVESQAKPWAHLTASEVLNLTSSKIKTIWKKIRPCDNVSGCPDNGEHSLEEVSQGKKFGDEGESNFGICKLISLKAKEISWPWKGREQNKLATRTAAHCVSSSELE